MMFLTLFWYESYVCSVEATLWIGNFDLFLGFVVWFSLVMLGSGSELQMPVSHVIMWLATILYLYSHGLFDFQYSIHKLHEVFKTLLWIGFALDDFAQQ